MSPAKARPRTLYLLIFLNVLLLALSVWTLYHARGIADRVGRAEERSYASCVRGNVLREGYRFAMLRLGSPERAEQPEVRDQPCAAIYSGGVP